MVGDPCLEHHETWGTHGWAVSAHKKTAYETWDSTLASSQGSPGSPRLIRSALPGPPFTKSVLVPDGQPRGTGCGRGTSAVDPVSFMSGDHDYRAVAIDLISPATPEPLPLI